jgi:hypothetical protein
VRATPVQREILRLAADGGIEDCCYDYYAICVGQHRHLPHRTLEALARNGWVASDTHPQSSTIYWFLTDAGRAAVGIPVPTRVLGGE